MVFVGIFERKGEIFGDSMTYASKVRPHGPKAAVPKQAPTAAVKKITQ